MKKTRAPKSKGHMFRRLAGAGTAASAVFALGWAGYAAAAWRRYGTRTARPRSDGPLARFMPGCEVAEVHETLVDAPAALAWEAITTLSLDRSRLVRAIFRGRELLMRAHPGPQPARPFLDEIRALGWSVLAEVPGRQLVFGAATRPREADVRFRGMPPEDFARFDEPGYAKIAWSVAVERAGENSALFRTETRVSTTDPVSRERFRRYWSVFSPGILLIRYEMLRLVRAEAERRHRARLLAASEPAPLRS